nr:hypothetical protein [Tanacetum cinerariifolium]
MRDGHRQRSQFVNLTQTDGLPYNPAAVPVQLRLTVENKQVTVNGVSTSIATGRFNCTQKDCLGDSYIKKDGTRMDCGLLLFVEVVIGQATVGAIDAGACNMCDTAQT